MRNKGQRKGSQREIWGIKDKEKGHRGRFGEEKTKTRVTEGDMGNRGQRQGSQREIWEIKDRDEGHRERYGE